MPDNSDGHPRPSFLNRIIAHERRESYKRYLRALTREELQAARDVYKQPFDGQQSSPSYEAWITENTSRDPDGLDKLNIVKSEIARRDFLKGKGVDVEPGALLRMLMGPRGGNGRQL